MKSLPATFGLVCLAFLLACAPAPSDPATTAEGPVTEAAETDASPAAERSFINRVWVVAESEQVSAGALRVFLSEGSLVMASENSTPSFGQWRQDGTELIITEVGRDYPVDVLELDGERFHIRMRGPGEPVEIRFEEASTDPAP